VVDDEDKIREIVRSYLEREGFDVAEARDGEAALKAAREWSPDLVVLDVMMPGRDGFEVLEEMRSRPDAKDIPVVLLTAKATDADVWKGWSAGADYYMTKPFKPEDLAQFAHNILGTK
jgi:two-component system, OmpR family, alkaline phosphatase synthesis response regulator PhoP